MTEFIEKKYVKKNSIEKRDYQINLAKQAAGENCVVVLPTGLGKTAVALHVISEYLAKGEGGILFLAPTRVLVNQHYEFLKNNLTLDDISLITGEDLIQKRTKLWNNSIVCATPEIARNDLIRGIVTPEQFSLVIFDEVHRTVGDYAYSGIAERFEDSPARILGMTATLPSEKEKATEILTKLRISSVAERTENSPDVKPYTQETNTEWINVELPPELKTIQTLLKLALDERYTILRKNGIKLAEQQSLSALLRIRQFVLNQNRRSAKPLF
ncbi:MAG: DEAD/DEAH box helicase family protein, partial [Nitrosopumilus sp.]|nr:DEAD/DEAH box helicase family protein [Nitrosopumilus sp.]